MTCMAQQEDSTLRRTFRSLRIRNYKLFFFGQLISVSGIWMEYTAQAWLVLELTGSGSAVGVASGLRFAPLLILGPWAGVVADRADKRKVIIATQGICALSAGLMAVLIIGDVIALWMVYVLSFIAGLGTAFENPTRRAFIAELVPTEDVNNAVSLNGSLASTGRAFGPAAAGLIIATVGTGAGFAANGLSYLVSMTAFAMMNPKKLYPLPRLEAAPGQLRQGFRYAVRDRRICLSLVLIAIVSTLAFTYPVTVPLVATRVFNTGPLGFGLLMSVLSIGSLLGSLHVAGKTQLSYRYLAGVTMVLGVVGLATAAAPSLLVFGVLLFLTGAAGTAFAVTDQALLQRDAARVMVGRIMALYSVAFIGSNTFGGPLGGWVADLISPRAGLAVGPLAALIVGALAYAWVSGRFSRLPFDATPGPQAAPFDEEEGVLLRTAAPDTAAE